MGKKIKFTKMVASGNDFIIIGRLPFTVYRLPNLAKVICDRKFGAGADGLLVLEKSKIADIGMRIFNADGSQAPMCGNGARCLALYQSRQAPARLSGLAEVKIETKAGVIEAEIKDDNVKIKLTDPKDVRLQMPIRLAGRTLKVNFINTGVAHTVIFAEGVDKVDVFGLGRQIRYHKKFLPYGTNVDFVEALGSDCIKIRTYERGVEGETLACGTGAAASALVFAMRYALGDNRLNVVTKSQETLKVYFKRDGSRFKDVWLEGKARIVYQGEYYV